MHLDQRIYIAALLLPLILLGCVPNLKYLAPVSMFANICMGVGLSITIYYLVQDIPDASLRPQFSGSVNTIPQFFSIVIFAMEAIGVVSIYIYIYMCVCVCVCVCVEGESYRLGLVNGAFSVCRYAASNWKLTCE